MPHGAARTDCLRQGSNSFMPSGTNLARWVMFTDPCGREPVQWRGTKYPDTGIRPDQETMLPAAVNERNRCPCRTVPPYPRIAAFRPAWHSCRDMSVPTKMGTRLLQRSNRTIRLGKTNNSSAGATFPNVARKSALLMKGAASDDTAPRCNPVFRPPARSRRRHPLFFAYRPRRRLCPVTVLKAALSAMRLCFFLLIKKHMRKDLCVFQCS